ncbi:MAG: FecR domain-containing protein [Minicystis sp.]
MSRERPLTEASLSALGGAVRREVNGEVDKGEHERGRERALAAFGRKRRPATRMVVGLAAAAFAAVIAIAIAMVWPRAPIHFTVDGAVAAAGAYVHAAPGGAGAMVRFSDGSEIAFAAGGSGRIAEVGPHGARVLLESGSASVRVVHLPSARWSVEAGPFAIAVIGTAFEVSWSSETQTLEVDLREGAVSVRGPPAPGGIGLRAGQRLVARVADGEIRIGEARVAPASPTLPLPPPMPATPAPMPAPEPPIVAAPTISSARPARRVAPPANDRWPERVAAGEFRRVLAEAEARGIDAVLKQVPLADLVALADAARYAGRADVARRALVAQRERFASTTEAHTSAFLLGRLADDAGGAPEVALRWYDRYLVEAPGGTFAAEALGRKMMVLRRAGDPAAAAVAAEYLRLHPAGPHAAAAREIVSR